MCVIEKRDIKTEQSGAQTQSLRQMEGSLTAGNPVPRWFPKFFDGQITLLVVAVVRQLPLA